MGLRRNIQLLALLLIGASLSHLALACPKTNCVRIGTWNLDWLGSENRQQPADKKTIEAMVDLVANQLSIDLITLQEVNTQLSGNVHGEHYSQQPWQDLQAALKKNGYALQSSESGYAQHIVLAWRAPVTLKTARDLPVPDHYEFDRSCRSAHLRKPLAGWFRVEAFDFWLVGLHLKANGPHTKCTSAIRDAQTHDLRASLNPLIEKDADAILIGDFNSNDTESFTFNNTLLAIDGKGNRSVASNSRSFQSTDGKQYAKGGLLDHIMITPAAKKNWQIKSTTIYKPANTNAFTQTFSDHVPLWADFDTTNNHD